MAKSAKKASTKTPSPTANAKTNKAKSPGPRVRTGVADGIRSFLKQAGKPVTLAQLNEGVGKTHSKPSIYSALQYMGRRKEIARKGRGAKATFAVNATASTKSASATKKAQRATSKSSGTSAVSHFASMVADLERLAETAERNIMLHAKKSTDRAIRALAEMAADMRAKAAKFSMK
jgi:hypothetical protein